MSYLGKNLDRRNQTQQKQFFRRLQGKPFWIWDKEVHRQWHARTSGNCCFNHIIGLPEKKGVKYPLFDYEKTVCDALEQTKHVWIKKATGLGITELMLRNMAWLCLRDNSLRGSRMCIVTGPRIDLAITLIDRIKGLFPETAFDTRETLVILNGIKIEAFPSHHLDDMRGLANVSFILLDEADFFPPGQQQDARHVSERYIAKSDPYIVMASTPNAPDGLFEEIEREHEDECLYKRIYLNYTVGLGKIYTHEEIRKARASPSFDREYDLKYAGKIGNIFHARDIDAAIELGRQYDPRGNYDSPKSLGIDPAFGSSNFAFVITQIANGRLEVVYAEEFERPDFVEMVDTAVELVKYQYNINKVYVDGSNPAIVTALKAALGDRTDYNKQMEYLRAHRVATPNRWMKVIPVSFHVEHKEMLGNAKMLLEKGIVAINPVFSKLITSLRTATELEGTLIKADTLHNDLFDAFRLSLKYYSIEQPR
jgi:hypothetical protein